MNKWVLLSACLLFVTVTVFDHVDRRKSARAALLTVSFMSLLGFGLYLRLDFLRQFDLDDAVKFSVALAAGLALTLHSPRLIEEPWVCLAATCLLILLPWSQGNLRSVGVSGHQIQVLPLAVVPFCVFLSRALADRRCLLLAPPVVAFIAWRDLGSSLVYVIMFVLAAVLTLKGGAAKAASVILLALALGALAALHSGLVSRETLDRVGADVLAKYQSRRFDDFNRGGSEEVQRTRVAVVSGGLTGHRDSEYELSRRVSEAERDLTIAIVAERTGLVGILGTCAAVITIFVVGMLVAGGLASAGSVGPGADEGARNAAQDAALAALVCSRPLVEMLLALGTSTHLFVQTGIPLPFFSDAPASLISHMMGFALLLQLTEHERNLPQRPDGALRHRLRAVRFLLLVSAAGALLWLGGIYLDWEVAASPLNRRLAEHIDARRVGAVTDAEGRPLTRASADGVRPLAAPGLVGFLDLDTARGQGLVDLYRTRLLGGADGGAAALSLFLNKEFPPGVGVRTTLDLDYQKACDDILKNYPEGFIGLMDSRDGRILCASGKGSSQYFDHLLHGVYEPGSIFKLLDLIALAERYGDGLPSRQHVCTGRLRLGPQYEVVDRGHGAVNYRSATAESCNTFYASESWDVSERVTELAGLLGVNRGLKFQGFGVARGSYEERPSRPVAAMQHLGLGPVRVSPVHLLRLGAAVVEGGAMPAPVLVLNDPAYPATPQTQRLFDARVAPLVEGATVEVVESGTGRAARIEGRRIGGKTGTVGGKRDAAGFLGFDFDRHLVALVLLKTKGYGGEVAAPETRKLLLLAK